MHFRRGDKPKCTYLACGSGHLSDRKGGVRRLKLTKWREGQLADIRLPKFADPLAGFVGLYARFPRLQRPRYVNVKGEIIEVNGLNGQISPNESRRTRSFALHGGPLCRWHCDDGIALSEGNATSPYGRSCGVGWVVEGNLPRR
ncbi:MAG: hypothetical protein ACTS4T_01400 [Candidatus Hodgkinia cicadicola]